MFSAESLRHKTFIRPFQLMARSKGLVRTFILKRLTGCSFFNVAFVWETGRIVTLQTSANPWVLLLGCKRYFLFLFLTRTLWCLPHSELCSCNSASSLCLNIVINSSCLDVRPGDASETTWSRSVRGAEKKASERTTYCWVNNLIVWQ